MIAKSGRETKSGRYTDKRPLEATKIAVVSINVYRAGDSDCSKLTIMANNQSFEQHTLLLQQRDLRFKGSALVRISAINIVEAKGRAVNDKNVTRLKEIFELKGCLPAEPQNHVPVFVTQELLDSSLQKSGVEYGDLMKPSTFKPARVQFPESSLECLHGKHRLIAAIQYLPPKDQWWVVDLYLQDHNDSQLGPYFNFEYLNSLNITDGEILRQILLCHQECNQREVGEWMSRLSKTKRKEVKQLMGHSMFLKAFTDLLPLPGLWVGIKLGALHRFLTLKCDEVNPCTGKEEENY
jgi:hypothetical protein